MNRIALTCCIALMLAPVFKTTAEEWDLGEYEEELTGVAEATSDPDPRPNPPAFEPAPETRRIAPLATTTPPATRVARASAPVTAPAVEGVRPEPEKETAARIEDVEGGVRAQDAVPETIIRFGAGASWIHPVRLGDDASDDKLMTEFSVSWAPFGLPGEIGLDLLIARDQKFVVRPNLKFYFFKHYWFSIFMEGACDVLFLADSNEVGGGGGLGVVIGLTDTLAIELKGSVTIYSLSPAGDHALFGSPDTEPLDEGRQVALLPAATARLMARF